MHRRRTVLRSIERCCTGARRWWMLRKQNVGAWASRRATSTRRTHLCCASSSPQGAGTRSWPRTGPGHLVVGAALQGKKVTAQAQSLPLRAKSLETLRQCKRSWRRCYHGREEVSEKQLRDDLLSMLVAGHETTGSALTWTLHLLASNPDTLQKARPLCPATGGNSSWRSVQSTPPCYTEDGEFGTRVIQVSFMLTQAQEEVDRVLGDRQQPSMADYQELRYTMRCVIASNIIVSVQQAVPAYPPQPADVTFTSQQRNAGTMPQVCE